MDQSTIELAPYRKRTCFMPSAKLVEFGDLIDAVFTTSTPQDTPSFIRFINGTRIDPSVTNAFLCSNGRTFEATRTSDGLFIDGNQTIDDEQTSIDVDPDGDDINIVARGTLPECFASRYRIHWYQAGMKFKSGHFTRKDFEGATSFVASAENATTETTLIFIVYE